MVAKLDNNYASILQGLKAKIKGARLRAALIINTELLNVYWEIGNAILIQQQVKGWGVKIIDRLGADLKQAFPDMQGLSTRNLKYMRAFAEAYPNFQIGQQSAKQPQKIENESVIIVQRIVAQLPWGHICTLLDKLETAKERAFYAQKTVQNSWTRPLLSHHIDSGLIDRAGALTSNFEQTLPSYESELASQIFKDPYHLDFVMLGDEARERDLENAMMDHITQLLLELGEGFAFLGRQKRFEVGGQEFFIDLLFYHTRLRRYVIIDLKAREFQAEYISKMNVYLGLADDKLKGEFDEPAIGLILCKTKNKIIAEYALRDFKKPIGIAQYKIDTLLPDDIKGKLPSIEEIEQKLDEELTAQRGAKVKPRKRNSANKSQ